MFIIWYDVMSPLWKAIIWKVNTTSKSLEWIDLILNFNFKFNYADLETSLLICLRIRDICLPFSSSGILVKIFVIKITKNIYINDI